MKKHEIRKLGGPGSGHHGHKGIPGQRGGSMSRVSAAGGFMFNPLDKESLGQALKDAKWSVGKTGPTGTFTKWKRVDGERGMRLQIVSDRVMAQVGQLSDGTIAAGTPLNTYQLGRGEIPNHADLRSWIITGAIERGEETL